MNIDFKKTQKELYDPKKPAIIDVPAMPFIMVDGSGNPNTSEAYKKAVEILYTLTYTIKMSEKSGNAPKGYFGYVVPPLEGLWWLSNGGGVDFTDKSKYCWTSMIRQPDFVTAEVFEEAKAAASRKKPELDLTAARFELFTEGLCAHVIHRGPYDEEPKTLNMLKRFITESGYQNDISDKRRHHEIYLTNPLKTAPENLRTVLRTPVKKGSL